MHQRTEPWRRGKYEPDGRHGPEQTTMAGNALFRSWTTCLDCGVRLERAMLSKGEAKR